MSQNFMFTPSPSAYTQRVLQYKDGDLNVAEEDGQQVQAAQPHQGFMQHAQEYTAHAGEYDVGAGGSGMQPDGAGSYIGLAADHPEPIPGAQLGVREQSVVMLELKKSQEGFSFLVLKSCELQISFIQTMS
jgi:hypothetical protein